ncbi:hypothetical protein WE348_10310 [Alteromonas macleodii]|mgnify:FL=1|uniref:hypothetical protein n=1 Tax=Alteromonas macleodii TaxID=28108 RepID=UPI0030CD1166|tara:strand:- start:8377 stop:8559 length:183 start_codon:yes stop_codon:yes gene_type:complete
MTENASQWHELEDGFAIYKQPSSRNWYLYVRIDGQQIRLSLKTSDFAEAKSDALFFMGAK